MSSDWLFRSSSEGITVGDDSEKAPLPRIHVLHRHLMSRATLLLELWLQAKVHIERNSSSSDETKGSRI